MTVKELREISGCSIKDCEKALLYCENHHDCTPDGYLKALGCAVVTKCSFDERVKHFSRKEESNDNIFN